MEKECQSRWKLGALALDLVRERGVSDSTCSAELCLCSGSLSWQLCLPRAVFDMLGWVDHIIPILHMFSSLQLAGIVLLCFNCLLSSLGVCWVTSSFLASETNQARYRGSFSSGTVMDVLIYLLLLVWLVESWCTQDLVVSFVSLSEVSLPISTALALHFLLSISCPRGNRAGNEKEIWVSFLKRK